MSVRPPHMLRPVQRLLLSMSAVAAFGLVACGPSDEELAQTCIADYAMAAQVKMDERISPALGMSIAATATRSFEAVLMVDDDGASAGEWSACPDNFTAARDRAVAALPAFKNGMDTLAQGPAGNLAQMTALRDALTEFRAAWVDFSEVTLTHLNDPEIAGQLTGSDYSGLEAYLERQVED